MTTSREKFELWYARQLAAGFSFPDLGAYIIWESAFAAGQNAGLQEVLREWDDQEGEDFDLWLRERAGTNP